MTRYLGATLAPLTATGFDRAYLEAQEASLTYAHVGATLAPRRGLNTRRKAIDIGLGTGAFASARDALLEWAPQRAIGARIHPDAQRVAQGATVLLVLGIRGVGILAPDRVVAVIDEPDRFAYAYGTLPGHPECGEESFDLTVTSDGTVSFAITVDAHASPGLPQLASPIVRLLQDAALNRYLAAVALAARRLSR